MPDSIDIRSLGADDVALMRGVNAMFCAAFDDAPAYGSRPPEDAYLQDVLSRPNVIALAAVERDRVVGGLVAYVLDKLEQARREVYLYDLAVAESHRRRGIATALIRGLQQRARECGAYVVFVQADLGDEPAVALYEKLGVREDVLHFDLDMHGDEAGTSAG